MRIDANMESLKVYTIILEKYWTNFKYIFRILGRVESDKTWFFENSNFRCLYQLKYWTHTKRLWKS